MPLIHHWALAYLALDCERVGEPVLDPTEQLEVAVFDEARVRALLAAGDFADGFTALALFQALLRVDAGLV